MIMMANQWRIQKRVVFLFDPRKRSLKIPKWQKMSLLDKGTVKVVNYTVTQNARKFHLRR
jgi:hypothetical protein